MRSTAGGFVAGPAVHSRADSERVAGRRVIWAARLEVLCVSAGRFEVAEARGHPLVLYDGVCGLCNRTVQFVLRRDRADVFRFAALQSGLAARILARHGADATDLDTLYVVLNPEQADEGLLARSDAVLYILGGLGAVWRMIASVLKVVPRGLRDWVYGLVARYRYGVFGKYDTCPVPSAETRRKFLE